MVSEYLSENNVEGSDKMMSLIVQNPQLVQQCFPEIINYYCKKYDILTLLDKQLNPILYYE